jgi:hypothetical protein
VNAQTEKIFEYSRGKLVGRERHAGHRAGFPREPRARPMGAGLELFARGKNAAQFPLKINLIPLVFRRVRLVYNAILDISEGKYSEKAQRRSRGKDLLLSEIYHRLANTLPVFASLLNLPAGQLADSAARHMFEASQSRIRSMALVHEQLYQSGDFAGVAPLPADLLTRDSKFMGLRKVLTRPLNGKRCARSPGGPKFKIVFSREARRK